MNRIKGYLVYLLIPAIPYLLMIYRPDIVDSIFQYLAHGTGYRYVWVMLIVILLWSLHSAVTADFRSSKVRGQVISLTKWYLMLIAIMASMYILLTQSISFRILIIGVSFSVIAFYIIATMYGKKSA